MGTMFRHMTDREFLVYIRATGDTSPELEDTLQRLTASFDEISVIKESMGDLERVGRVLRDRLRSTTETARKELSVCKELSAIIQAGSTNDIGV